MRREIDSVSAVLVVPVWVLLFGWYWYCVCMCVVLMLKDNTELYGVFARVSGLALAAVSSCTLSPKELSDYHFLSLVLYHPFSSLVHTCR